MFDLFIRYRRMDLFGFGAEMCMKAEKRKAKEIEIDVNRQR